MSEDKKQITMTFSGYDDNQDNTLMFEGPVYIAAILNNVSDLFTFNVSAYEDSDALVVYVRNVNSEDAVTKGELTYRGSFYKYNWDTKTWGQIALGNHSHSNMAILDQLGEINTADMKIGEKKVLTIKKLNYGDYQIRLYYGIVQWAYVNSSNWNDFFTLEDKIKNYPICDDPKNMLEITTILVDKNIYYAYKFYNSAEKVILTNNSGEHVLSTEAEPEFKIEDRRLYWKQTSATIWNLICELDEVRLNNTEVQWKYVYDDYWTDIDNTINIKDNRSEFLSSYQYKLEYEDIPESKIPKANATNGRQYLSADSSGNFSWVESFAPKQTFKLLKINVSTEFIGNMKSSKKLTLSKEYLDENGVLYDPKYNDEIIVFDSGKLVTDIAVGYIDGALSLTVTNDIASDTFELGETITILIIRSGIDGLIDSIQDQYMKKSEVIELLSNGSLHLNDYVTKKDLEDYAALKNHTHAQYLTRSDTDVFDFRYADYQHTHFEYITKAEVLSILADAAEDDGSIDLEGTVSSLVNELQTYVNNKISDYYTREQTRVLLDATVENLKYTDSIEMSNIPGMNLTSYLIYLNNKVSETSAIDADTVELENDVVNLGDPNASIGGWKNADKIEKGKITLTDFIHKLITREVIPNLKAPEFDVEYSSSTYEVGSANLFTYKPMFIQNDGGDVTLIKLLVYKGYSEDPSEYILTNNEENTLSLIMDAADETGFCYKLEFLVDYDDGESAISNVGKTYKVSAGHILKTINLYCKRYIYAGSLGSYTDILEVDDLYNGIYVDKKLEKYELTDDIIKNGLSIIMKKNIDQTFIFAIPVSYDYTVDEIIYKNQCTDIKDDCDRLYTTKLRDVQGQTENKIDNRYNVWFYSLVNKAQTNIPIQITFKKKED